MLRPTIIRIETTQGERHGAAQVEIPEGDLDIDDMLQLVRQVLLAVGYHPDTIAKALP